MTRAEGEPIREDWDAVRKDWENSVYARADAEDDRREQCTHTPVDCGSTIRCSKCGELLDVHGF